MASYRRYKPCYSSVHHRVNGGVQGDGNNRLHALNTTVINFSNETETIITDTETAIVGLESEAEQIRKDAEAEIERVKLEIEVQRSLISQRKLLQAGQEELIKGEVNKVEKIVNFIAPVQYYININKP